LVAQLVEEKAQELLAERSAALWGEQLVEPSAALWVEQLVEPSAEQLAVELARELEIDLVNMSIRDPT